MLALCLLISGCGADLPQADTESERQSDLTSPQNAEKQKGQNGLTLIKEAVLPDMQNAPSAPSEDFVSYKAPAMATVEFHRDLAEGGNGVQIDLSAVSEGYFAISAVSDKRLKLQVFFYDLTYTYDISSEGTPSFFPLQCGDGLYIFRVMENISGTKYAQLYRTECEVKLIDEFQPFIRPSDYSRYDENSACVAKAAELASNCRSKLEVVSAVYAFVCKNIKYDSKKASTVKSGYLPDVDDTLSTKKGICFDYAALAAAMLRSQGIPTKMIFGYVAPDDLYHAWNMFYTEESGWVTVKFEVTGKNWTRMDLTFSAGGVSAAFVGDGSHYTDVYSY